MEACQTMSRRRGTVLVNIQDEHGNVRKSTLNNALYVPSYPQNIFSVQAATERGAKINFSSDHAELISKNWVKFPIQKRGKLYYLYKSSVENVRSCNLETWHRILGHCNRSDVLNLENVVRGMKISDKSEYDCRTCVLGKQTNSRNRKPDIRATEPMQFIHTDLSGAVDPVSRDGFRYGLTFTDDFSGTIFSYFLKHKSDAAEALNKFLADTAPFGKIEQMRSDNGGEYISEEFESILIKNKIKHELSCPYSPHQNGTAERGWRTLFEMGRCLLLESGLPKPFWTYAVMAAVYIRNRCFNQRTHETPYYLLTSRRPDLSKLHVFGTICYPYIEEYMKKLDPRSSEGIFVGYDKNSPAYLIYYPNSNIVRRHRTVKFTDKFKNTHDKQIPNNHISGEFENDATVQNELSINGIETQIDDIHTGKQSDDDIDELN